MDKATNNKDKRGSFQPGHRIEDCKPFEISSLETTWRPFRKWDSIALIHMSSRVEVIGSSLIGYRGDPVICDGRSRTMICHPI